MVFLMMGTNLNNNSNTANGEKRAQPKNYTHISGSS